MKSKCCSVCKVNQALTAFSKQASARDGLQYRCKRCTAEARLMCRYGINLNGLEELLNKQNSQCQICGKHLVLGSKTLNVDHDHTTGEVRGILCQPCNAAIGLLEEDVERIRRAALYLEAF